MCSRWFGGQAEVVLAAPLVKAKVVRVAIMMIKVLWRTIVKMVIMLNRRMCELRQNRVDEIFSAHLCTVQAFPEYNQDKLISKKQGTEGQGGAQNPKLARQQIFCPGRKEVLLLV